MTFDDSDITVEGTVFCFPVFMKTFIFLSVSNIPPFISVTVLSIYSYQETPLFVQSILKYSFLQKSFKAISLSI